MAVENSLYDKKSLKTVIGKTADFNELAKDCVAFANSKGGILAIGIEDEDTLPPVTQKIDDTLIATIEKRIAENTINVTAAAEKVTAENGGEYIKLRVIYNAAAIASTSDGKYYMRSGDSSRPVKADEIALIFTDRTSFVWETQHSSNKYDECDKEKLSKFISDIRGSERVSTFVKSKTDDELLSYYFLITNDRYLTNLGSLWIGTQIQRASIGVSPKIQVIKYDDHNVKINKFMYDDDIYSPAELIDCILKDIPDWQEYYEIPNVAKRDRVYAYEYKVIRELLVNALVHRPYTMRGDIFIKLYPNRMEIMNPGSLPIGITPENIISSSFQRNERFSKIFFDLDYMEKEGSGYHLMYELLLLNGKPLPIVEDGRDFVKVTINRKPVSDETYLFMNKFSKQFTLDQRQTIALGQLSQSKSFNIENVAYILKCKYEVASKIIDEIYTAGIVSKLINKDGEDSFVVKGNKDITVIDKNGVVPELTETPPAIIIKNNSNDLGGTLQVTPQDTPQVKIEKLVEFCKTPRSQKEMMEFLDLKDRKNFTDNYIKPLLGKRLEYTIPEKPTSSKQKYIAILNNGDK